MPVLLWSTFVIIDASTFLIASGRVCQSCCELRTLCVCVSIILLNLSTWSSRSMDWTPGNHLIFLAQNPKKTLNWPDQVYLFKIPKWILLFQSEETYTWISCSAEFLDVCYLNQSLFESLRPQISFTWINTIQSFK